MGKTYKSLIDDDYGVDLYEDDMNLELDVDESMESFLDNQNSMGNPKNQAITRGAGNKSDHQFDDNQHRLPADWQDFDYAPESDLDDDWH